jgi:hypothetical protein
MHATIDGVEPLVFDPMETRDMQRVIMEAEWLHAAIAQVVEAGTGYESVLLELFPMVQNEHNVCLRLSADDGCTGAMIVPVHAVG